jgi:putative membrane protein
MFVRTALLAAATVFATLAQQPDKMQSGSNASLSSADQTFLSNAAKGGQDEVEMGRIATANAASPKVKQFGQRMVNDHTKANKELEALAKKRGWAIPSSAPGDHSSMSSKKGADFDKAYSEDMVKDHDKDVAEFEKEASSGQDPDLKAFAAKTLPTLRDHLALAKQLP